MVKKELHSLKWSAIYQVLTSGISYITLIILARHYGPKHYGILIFGFTLLEFLKIISDPGISIYNISIFSRVKNKSNYIVQSFYAKFILSLFGFLLFSIGIILYPTVYEIKVILFVFALSVFPVIFDSRWIFQGDLKMNYSFFSRAVFRIVFLLFVILAYFLKLDYYFIPYLLLLASIIGFLTSFPLVHKHYGNLKIRIKELKYFKETLIKIIPIGINQILLPANNILTILILGYLLKSNDVGQFGAAYKYSLFLSGLLSIVLNSLLPIISRFNSNRLMFHKYSRFYWNILLLFIFSIIAPLMIYTDFIFKFLYGKEYIFSINLAKILTFSAILYAYIHFIGYQLISKRKQKYYTSVLSLGFIVNVFFLLILIPRYGIYGAGYSILISAITSSLLMLYYENKFLVNRISDKINALIIICFSLIATNIIYIYYKGILGFILSIFITELFNVIYLMLIPQLRYTIQYDKSIECT